MRQARTAISTLLGLAVLLLIGLAIAAQLNVVHLRVVQSSSMEPELSVGDLLVNRSVDPVEAEEGDIATIMHPDGHLVTHRVLSNEPGDSADVRVIEMQGDDNVIADAVPYQAATAEVTVVKIPWVGQLNLWFGTGSTIWIALGVAGALMIVAALFWPTRARTSEPAEETTST